MHGLSFPQNGYGIDISEAEPLELDCVACAGSILAGTRPAFQNTLCFSILLSNGLCSVRNVRSASVVSRISNGKLPERRWSFRQAMTNHGRRSSGKGST